VETSLHIPAHTVWSLAVVGLLTVLAFSVFLRRLRAGRARRVAVGLRVLALGGILMLYVQPGLRVEEVLQVPSTVLVVVDESASMQARDQDGRTRAERVRAFFETHSAWLDRLEQEHHVQYFACSDSARAISRETLRTPLGARGAATDLWACLREVLSAAPEIGGVVIVTDGADPAPRRDQRGPSTDEGAAGKPASTLGPVLVLLASDPAPILDLAVASIHGTEMVLARNLARVRASVRGQGVASQRLAARLWLDGEEVDHAEFVTPGPDAETEVTFSFLPREPGRHLLAVVLPAVPGESCETNNRYWATLSVVRDRLRILHVAGHPSWDQRFLRGYLRQRPGTELISFHTLRDPDAIRSPGDADDTLLIPFPAEEIFVRSVDSFDLIVLQDEQLPEADRTRLASRLDRYVREGGGLLWFGGSLVLGALGPWPEHVASLLPVQEPSPPGRGMLQGRFQVSVPPDARLHEVLRGRAGEQPLWRRLLDAPALPAVNRVGPPAPGAVVLAEAVGADAERVPLIATMVHGSGRVGLVATDALWRWAFSAERAVDTYRALLDGLVAYLTKDPSASPLIVRAARDRVPVQEPVEVEVIAPRPRAHLEAVLQAWNEDGGFESDGPRAEADLDANGRARLVFTVQREGPHRVRVSLPAEGLAGGDLFVAGPDLRETADLSSHGRVAREIGRRFHAEVRALADPGLERFHPRPGARIRTGARVEFPIWDHPSILLLVLAALGLEWYLERRTEQR